MKYSIQGRFKDLVLLGSKIVANSIVHTALLLKKAVIESVTLMLSTGAI
ncbi:MAG: hypothetical protein F6K36_09330 [Symploca sp. SIO3C6]|uniref:Uncharacterized protein n=1 Tax=Symploca sp. SIO1C4 TaxID=2607765 RepID=A0A6B3NNP9_9CYAN|nr:hypothetical protein [Symploca sp. SIO3C6]NER30848.1 hypothetical protein [Symploca sp. SIO1C4]NET04912.1 hypothetical protein [Symploca sp. SIO2B6]